ncbi:hypothetical protein INR49_006293, partial [Caranx melampygus]
SRGEEREECCIIICGTAGNQHLSQVRQLPQATERRRRRRARLNAANEAHKDLLVLAESETSSELGILSTEVGNKDCSCNNNKKQKKQIITSVVLCTLPLVVHIH